MQHAVFHRYTSAGLTVWHDSHEDHFPSDIGVPDSRGVTHRYTRPALLEAEAWEEEDTRPDFAARLRDRADRIRARRAG